MRLTRKRSRTGFSLIELLAVIAIIGILVGLVAYGVSKVIGSQRRNNTEEAMSTIQKTLAHHWAYVVSEARKETGLELPYQVIDSLFGPDTSGGERNRVIWIKMRLMEAFPTSYDEITKSATNLYPYKTNIIPFLPKNMRKNIGSYMSKLGGRTTKPATAASESSACLLLALSISRGGSVLDKDKFGAANVVDSDGDGMDEFVDNWGTPLTFFRFPTHNKNLQNANPASGTSKALKYGDSADPAGALFTWFKDASTTTAHKNQYVNNIHTIISPFNANAACYILPTVVSSGPDTKLGLFTTIANDMNVSNAADEADNLYTFKLRPGAGEEFR
jgi:prepilin-type N-terminal cleavage/methylation domain-containing protein